MNPREFFELSSRNRQKAIEIIKNDDNPDMLVSYVSCTGMTVFHLVAEDGDVEFANLLCQAYSKSTVEHLALSSVIDVALKTQNFDVAKTFLLCHKLRLTESNFENAFCNEEIFRMMIDTSLRCEEKLRTPTKWRFTHGLHIMCSDHDLLETRCILCSAAYIALSHLNTAALDLLIISHDRISGKYAACGGGCEMAYRREDLMTRMLMCLIIQRCAIGSNTAIIDACIDVLLKHGAMPHKAIDIGQSYKYSAIDISIDRVFQSRIAILLIDHTKNRFPRQYKSFMAVQGRSLAIRAFRYNNIDVFRRILPDIDLYQMFSACPYNTKRLLTIVKPLLVTLITELHFCDINEERLEMFDLVLLASSTCRQENEIHGHIKYALDHTRDIDGKTRITNHISTFHQRVSLFDMVAFSCCN